MLIAVAGLTVDRFVVTDAEKGDDGYEDGNDEYAQGKVLTRDECTCS